MQTIPALFAVPTKFEYNATNNSMLVEDVLDITWYGQTCCRIRDRDVSIVTDPYDKSIGLTLPRVRADIVTLSNPLSDSNGTTRVQGSPRVLQGPGEYEMKGIFITGILSSQRPVTTDDTPIRNTIFLFETDDLTICHLGTLGKVPTQGQLEVIGAVDILLIPVGGGSALDAAEAGEVISSLEPSIVIPILFEVDGVKADLDPVDRFIKQMGITEFTSGESLKISKRTMPEETQIVLLNCKQ